MRHTGKCLAIALLTAPALADAQSLWGATEYGMSVQQVQAVVPHAETSSRDAPLYNGSEELLHVADVVLANEQFDAKFYFRAERLTNVVLSLQESYSFRGAVQVFDAITQALRARYGREHSREITEDTVLHSAEADWITGRTYVHLLFVARGEDPARGGIAYQALQASSSVHETSGGPRAPATADIAGLLNQMHQEAAMVTQLGGGIEANKMERFDSASVGPGLTFVAHHTLYTLAGSGRDLTAGREYVASLRDDIVYAACGGTTRQFLDQGATVEHRYVSKDGALIGTVAVHASDCSP
jgi:hypothetical protein